MNFSKSWDQIEYSDLCRVKKAVRHHPSVGSGDEAEKRVWETCRREKQLFKETYANYLRSDIWQGKREAVLDRDKHECRFCGVPATEVHHLTYDRKFNESLFDLVSVCRDCHEAVHALK